MARLAIPGFGALRVFEIRRCPAADCRKAFTKIGRRLYCSSECWWREYRRRRCAERAQRAGV